MAKNQEIYRNPENCLATAMTCGECCCWICASICVWICVRGARTGASDPLPTHLCGGTPLWRTEWAAAGSADSGRRPCPALAVGLRKFASPLLGNDKFGALAGDVKYAGVGWFVMFFQRLAG